MIKVLIIDDEKEITDILDKQLSDYDFEVTVVGDSLNTLESLKNEKFDIVLLDVFMKHISGLEVMSSIREDKTIKNIPIIIMDELGGDANLDVAGAMGAVDFIIKGKTKISEIIDKIKKYTK